jgi:hypothetical protein
MAKHQEAADLREQLRLVEEELAGVRRTAAQLRAEIGSRSDGAVDTEDIASIITSAVEQDAVAASLATRRDDLQSRLDQIGATGT